MTNTNTITIPKPDDFHVHLRDGAILRAVLPYTTRVFGRALVMPNLTPAVETAEQILAYRDVILHDPSSGQSGFQPLMTFKITRHSTPEQAEKALTAGAIAGKLYPERVTTNSDDGITSIRQAFPIFELMQQKDAVVCLHGEAPNEFCLDRERAFLFDLHEIVQQFPRLRIVLEHITTAQAVSTVLSLPYVFATITPHHLIYTLDDVIGGLLQPHRFCKPIPKRSTDRDSLQWAATRGGAKFFLGTDSAPHLKLNKECSSGCAGVFNAICALETTLELFEDHGLVAEFGPFVSTNGASFYGLPPATGLLTIERESWTVPDFVEVPGVGSIVPFRAGETIRWKVKDYT